MNPFPPKTPWNELYVRSGLKNISDRVRQHQVVNRMRSAVDDLRTTMRKTTQEKLPEVIAAAERFVKHVLANDHLAAKPVVNATGVIAPDGVSLPLADSAIVAMTSAAAEFACEPATGGTHGAVERLLAELTGCEAALVLVSPAAGLTAALAALAEEGCAVIPRSQVCRIDEIPLNALASAAGTVLYEIGTVDRLTPEECHTALADEAASALLAVEGLDYELHGNASTLSLNELSAIARRQGKPLVAYASVARVSDFAMFDVATTHAPAKVQDLLAVADAVVFSGSRLLGGPGCGIVVGKRNVIARIAEHALAKACRADRATLAALEATLILLRDPTTAVGIPTIQLLSASDENLKQRAERIAAQLAGCPSVASAVAAESVCFWGEGPLPSRVVSTWSIQLTPKNESCEALAARLKELSPSIIGIVGESCVSLHLRSVLPRQDEQIVTGIRALSQSKASGTASTVPGSGEV